MFVCFPRWLFAAVPTTSVDIGQVAAAGSTSTANGVYTVRASGADIWGTQDEFRFFHAQLSGDGEITARVDSLTATDPWTKAGVMIRETLNANSRYAYTLVSAGNGVSFQHRLLAGASGGSARDARRGLTRAVLGASAPSRQRVHGVRLGQRTSLATTRQQRHHRNGRHRLRGPRRDEPSDGSLATAAFSNMSLSAGGTTPPPANRPPTITGTPPSTAPVGVAYAFTPTATDPDGNPLTYSIANRPSWATFNTTTGRLSGTPTSANVGSYGNIVIRSATVRRRRSCRRSRSP